LFSDLLLSVPELMLEVVSSTGSPFDGHLFAEGDPCAVGADGVSDYS
jgi:hypothetical protein